MAEINGKKKARILSVDDDANMNEIIRFRIEQMGHFVETCETVLSFLNKAEKEKFDLYLLDIDVEKKGIGIFAIEFLRKLVGSDIPILVLSGHTKTEIIARAFETGADDYLIKPIRKKEFQDKIEEALNPGGIPQNIVLKSPPQRKDPKKQMSLLINASLTHISSEQFILSSSYLMKSGCHVRFQCDTFKEYFEEEIEFHGTIIKNWVNTKNNQFEHVIQLSFSSDAFIKKMKNAIIQISEKDNSNKLEKK